MSKFINTEYKTTINSLVDGLKEKLNNPYYIFNDKKASIVNYYNRNITKSTLDEGTKHVYDVLGDQSPTKYNLIVDAYLYGIDKITPNLDVEDYGLESDSIEGEAIVLPNTFIPYPDDYFIIKHTDQDILFKVTSVNIDTLENGANFYKIQYKLDRTNAGNIDNQVVEEYKMIINNLGTNFKSVVRSTEYDMIDRIDLILVSLKKYFKSLFFNNKVQTFTFRLLDDYFYDPYLVEFFIKNKILDGDDEYVYVSHQTTVPKTFPITYDKTMFRAIELCDKNKLLEAYNTAVGTYIDDPNSLMSCRAEKYFKLDYSFERSFLNTIITVLDPEVLEYVKENKYYDLDNSKCIYNILIGYFNEREFGPEIFDVIDTIDYNSNITIFYSIPIIIYILEYYIKNLLK